MSETFCSSPRDSAPYSVRCTTHRACVRSCPDTFKPKRLPPKSPPDRPADHLFVRLRASRQQHGRAKVPSGQRVMLSGINRSTMTTDARHLTWFARATITSALHADPEALNALATSLAPDGCTDVTVSSVTVEDAESVLNPDMLLIHVKGKAIPGRRTTPGRS